MPAVTVATPTWLLSGQLAFAFSAAPERSAAAVNCEGGQ